MKISDTLPFLKQPPLFYQPLTFNGKNLTPNLLLKISITQSPLFYKEGRGIPTITSPLKTPKGTNAKSQKICV